MEQGIVCLAPTSMISRISMLPVLASLIGTSVRLALRSCLKVNGLQIAINIHRYFLFANRTNRLHLIRKDQNNARLKWHCTTNANVRPRKTCYWCINL